MFPHLSFSNIFKKLFSITKSEESIKNEDSSISFLRKVKKMPLRFLNSLLSGVVEYKYMFHKYCGINVRLNLNNLELHYSAEDNCFFSLELSLEWIYGRKGKRIFSGSFSPLGFAIYQKDDGNLVDDFCKKCLTLGGFLLKYEYDRRFYLNFGKIKTMWYCLKYIGKEDFWVGIVLNLLLSIEFGLNIIGVNDWRKKRKENLV